MGCMARGGSSPLRRMKSPAVCGAFALIETRADRISRGVATRAATSPPSPRPGGTRPGAHERQGRRVGDGAGRPGCAPRRARRRGAGTPPRGGRRAPHHRRRRVAELALDVDQRQPAGQPRRGRRRAAQAVQAQRGPQRRGSRSDSVFAPDPTRQRCSPSDACPVRRGHAPGSSIDDCPMRRRASLVGRNVSHRRGSAHRGGLGSQPALSGVRSTRRLDSVQGLIYELSAG